MRAAVVHRPLSLDERIADGVVHGVGIVHTLVLGVVLIVLAAIGFARPELPTLVLYLTGLVLCLSISLAFNLATPSRFKRIMERLDKAAIFLFIAASYTPFLALIWPQPGIPLLLLLIWATALGGMALRLVAPTRFTAVAIALYLCLGWSGVLVFGTLFTTLPAPAFWLLLAGGITLSAGVPFHLWRQLRFQSVVWHGFVVAGTALHLWALTFALVFARL
ncbi:MAG: hemolysin III family protein [Devosia sp.]